MAKKNLGLLILLLAISAGSILIGALAKLEHLWWGSNVMIFGLVMQLISFLVAGVVIYNRLKTNRR